MKLNENYVLQKVAGSWVIVPLGQTALDFNGMLTLNETGVFLWKALETGESRDDLVRGLIAEYEIPRELAETDTDAFLQKLKDIGCL